jgi:hypothetical protein
MGDGMDNSFIRPYISVEGIRERLIDQNEPEKTISIYKYDSGYKYNDSKSLMEHFNITKPEGTNPVQTYLITYPLFDMPLDFDSYLNGTLLATDASRVPQVDISSEMSADVARTVDYWLSREGTLADNSLSYNYWIDPYQGNSPAVDLGDMRSLLSDITFNTGTGFTIKVSPGNADQMQKAIRIRVPQLKIGDADDNDADSWVKGELNAGKTELVFTSSITDTDKTTPLLLLGDGTDREKKVRSEKIDIHVRLVDKIDAGNYETVLNFDWNSVKVKPNDDAKKSGEFKGFDFGSYLESLGDGVQFEKVPSFLYIKAPEGIDFKVEIKGSSAVTANNFSPKSDAVKEESSPPSWLDEKPASEYDFAGILSEENSTIGYTITPPSNVTLKSDEIKKDQKITVNLAVLLPMYFKFSGSDKITTGGETYYPIKFQGLDDFLGSDTGETSVMEEIDKQLGEGGVNSLILRLRDIKNEVTSAIYLAVATDFKKQDAWEIVEIANNKEADIEIKNVASLSALPPIKFLIKEDGQGQGGRLYIQSQETKGQTAFSVKISVVAGVNLDKTL